jgi:serine/threonine protein kinase
VLDFGIAKTAEIEGQSRRGKRLTRPGVAMGTPEYMAPEQAAGHPADPRSDIYAVGSIMYEMLTGRAPFEGDNVMEVLHKKANEPPPPLGELRSGLPPALVALVERTMARTPEERPQSMADLAYEIRTIENALITTPPPVVMPPNGAAMPEAAPSDSQAAPPEPSETRIVRPFMNRRPLYVAGAAAVGLGGLLAFLLFGRSSPSDQERQPSPPPPVRTIASPPPPPPVAPFDASPEAAPPAPAPSPETSEGSRREPAGHSLRPAATSTKELEEALHQAQQLLHAQRYDEARIAFGKLLGGRPVRGAAAAGLAQIAFQEKDYKQAADRAKESARWGGGVEARVLLGDAYFKLQRFEEAKRAYRDALKRDPNNRVAGQGLRLIERQEEPPK